MFYFILLPLLLILLACKFLYSRTHPYNLPPSPPSFPIAGHLHLLKPPIHKLFHKFSQKYGPIFSLRFGSRRIVVINSSSLVQESFTGQNDVVLTNRPLSIAAKLINYNGTTVGTSPYGDHWRNLRRICTTQVLSNHRLNNFLHVRTEEIHQMLTRLSRDTHANNGGFTPVNLQPVFSDLTFNNIVRMVTGKIYYGDDIKETEEALLFKKLVSDIAASTGANHPGDYLPVLKLFGNKYEKKCRDTGKAMDAFLQRLLDESKRDSSEGDSMVSHLLSMQQQQPEYYSDVTIKGLMMGLMAAGTESTAVMLEWAMANLVKYPKVLEKARLEIDDKIGRDRLIDESDIVVLPFLQNVVSETFRLFPVAPLLIPRATAEDIKIGGYDVPRDTIVVVNAWAIHRDPEIWDDPESFEPDRFSKIGYGREHYAHKLVPFGAGRRICPGVGLGERIVTLVLGTLVQCFDWKKVEGEEIDMSGGNGLTMRKVQPLRALCRPRPIMSKLL
ncbi:unnamed protein product [Thlaspi arvense]|uniref:Cytochrome P450 n=1 Tax=Thlaspi arvense TaxID=13288 RepID=A0AAU9T2H6_THLAR|nr:unnamed protein product [Thlaspi arvense]